MLKPSIFRTADGRNHLATFACIASLFLLWAICNSMIDVMDKHFQELLHLSKAQSAWVQTAHYLGYFLMALPAGWLAQRLGYFSAFTYRIRDCMCGRSPDAKTVPRFEMFSPCLWLNSPHLLPISIIVGPACAISSSPC
jgi:MFS family permease